MQQNIYIKNQSRLATVMFRGTPWIGSLILQKIDKLKDDFWELTEK